MAEALTLARPYAKAVFELARERREPERWSQLLALLTALVGNREAQVMLNDPRVPTGARAKCCWSCVPRPVTA